jgi:serine/threonine protein kinase/serine/threonine protein phosphatase PrpC
MSAGTLINTSVGAYRIVEFIGAGGMGEVYRGVHASLGRVVAVKVLTGSAWEQRAPAAMERFRNEARIHSTLLHPHIATLYEFFEVSGRPCIVMELVDGSTVEERLRLSGAYAPAEALRLFERVVDAVGYLHNRGIVHRDIKSNNVKVTSDGMVKLLDFGIAKAPSSPKLTATGGVIGTMHYLSPEQLRGGVAVARSDLWALGVLLYEMVTGRMPFDGPGAAQITERILRASYTPASSINSAVPVAVDAIIDRCLRVRPDERYASAEALLTDVRLLVVPAATPRPSAAYPAPVSRDSGELLRPTQRRWGIAAGLAVIALSIAIAIWPSFNRAPTSPSDSSVSTPANVPSTTNPSQQGRPATSLRTVTVDAFGGVADVVREGQVVGRTPYQFSAQLGDTIRLTLRRDGFDDLAVDFTVVETGLSYTYTLVAKRPLDLYHSSFPAWMVFPFWRRRKRVGQVASAANERTTGGTDAARDDRLAASVGLATDVGCVRQVNEDSIRIVHLATDRTRPAASLLAVVADGMGGHSAGEIASRLAVDVVSGAFVGERASETGDREPHAQLARAVRAANAVVFGAAGQDRSLTGMGTTCTALLVQDGQAYCAHVGDSRLYLARDGQIFRMTEDHSAVMEMVRRGELSQHEAARHPDKNVILRALGGQANVEVARWPHPFSVRAGDAFLLCSDGLSDLVDDTEILAALVESTPQYACDRLVALAKQRGGYDNVSVAVVALVAGDAASSAHAYTARTTRAVETQT